MIEFLKHLFKKESRRFALVKDAPISAILPSRKTKGSAGYDFFLPQDVVIGPHSYSEAIPTYVKAYFPEDEVLMLYIRSSIGFKKGVTLANNVGVIDSDYSDNVDNEGNIGLKLYNHTDHVVKFYAGECIMQGIFMKYGVVDNDFTTEERKGGLGSTGK